MQAILYSVEQMQVFTSNDGSLQLLYRGFADHVTFIATVSQCALLLVVPVVTSMTLKIYMIYFHFKILKMSSS